MPTHWLVLTTVHAPGAAVEQLLARRGAGWGVVVVGDARTPAAWAERPVEFLALARQADLFADLAAAAPIGHYARKNFGYLHARRLGAAAILDVDDDGFPLVGFPPLPSATARGRLIGGGDWVNVYRWFTDRLIWPRGLPLDAIRRRGAVVAPAAARHCPVQQFLVDDDPDVDAIHRLVFSATDVTFDPDAPPVLLEPGTWCPFNSQNTLWLAEAFPLLYLPSHCSPRVSDIWRSLVAQRALWLAGHGLAFHTATLRQARNPHDLMRDFADEIPVYLQNRAVAACLDRAADRLGGAGLAAAGRALWLALVDAGFLPPAETALIERWFDAQAARL
ncbi:MAG: STELLO glycosyltransferase family protein [Candidatus Binatia bacterium]